MFSDDLERQVVALQKGRCVSRQVFNRKVVGAVCASSSRLGRTWGNGSVQMYG